MITISIHGAEFFAYHGFYSEEQKLGGKFLVDVDASFLPQKSLKDDELSNTVDYERLYKLVDEQMKQTRKLIETVAWSIADQIKSNYPSIEKLQVSIKKCNPPLNGKVDYSCVTITDH